MPTTPTPTPSTPSRRDVGRRRPTRRPHPSTDPRSEDGSGGATRRARRRASVAAALALGAGVFGACSSSTDTAPTTTVRTGASGGPSTSRPFAGGTTSAPGPSPDARNSTEEDQRSPGSVSPSPRPGPTAPTGGSGGG